MKYQILDLDPETYERHAIHTQDRDWAETNCYIDIWIELLHGLGHEPIAAMPFTLNIDFEGDQWTFFKFQLSDLQKLYNIEVQELAIWKPLTKHIEGQVAMGRPVLVELDSMYLPDTLGTAYKVAHVKSTVAVNAIDLERQEMGYFHGQGYYHLRGDDFIKVFRLENEDESYLEPYVEIAKLSNNLPDASDQVVQNSIEILKHQLELIPTDNPFNRFKEKLHEDMNWLKAESLETFHAYSFATLRQFGSCFEQASVYLDWLIKNNETGLEIARDNYKQISEMTKIFQFQLARMMMRGKDVDLSTIDELAKLWRGAVNQLQSKYL